MCFTLRSSFHLDFYYTCIHMHSWIQTLNVLLLSSVVLHLCTIDLLHWLWAIPLLEGWKLGSLADGKDPPGRDGVPWPLKFWRKKRISYSMQTFRCNHKKPLGAIGKKNHHPLASCFTPRSFTLLTLSFDRPGGWYENVGVFHISSLFTGCLKLFCIFHNVTLL